MTFTKSVLFDNKKVDEIIIKTKATMKKNAIHKEQFIAMSSIVSSHLCQLDLVKAKNLRQEENG